MNSNKVLFFMILLTACLTQIGTDIYTPSLPAIAAELQVPIHLVQVSLAVYLLGVGLSLLFYGPLSEGFGRKPILIVGLAIMLVGSLVCLFAPQVQWLIAGRVIQGLGVGAAAGIWRAIFRDAFSGKEMAKFASYLTVVIMFVIPAAPALGGYLQQYFNWRSVFVFLSVYVVLAIALLKYCFNETSQHHHKDRLSWSFIKSSYQHIFKSSTFMGMAICVFLTFGTYFSWFVISPVLLIHHVGVSPVTYGWLSFSVGLVGYGLGGFFNGRFVERFGTAVLLRMGWSIVFLSGVMLLLSQLLFGLSLLGVIIPGVCLFFGASFVWPNAFATAMTPFGKMAGYAGSCYSLMQMGGGAILGLIASHLPAVNTIPMAIVTMITSLAAWIIYERVVK